MGMARQPRREGCPAAPGAGGARLPGLTKLGKTWALTVVKNLPYGSTATLQTKKKKSQERESAGLVGTLGILATGCIQDPPATLHFQHFSWRQQGWNKIGNKLPLGQGLANAQSVGCRGVWAFPRGGSLTPATKQEASGSQECTWASLSSLSATRPPAHTHSDTERHLRNKASFSSHCSQKTAFGKPSFSWKKGKELSGCLHSNNPPKSYETKTKPHPL